MFHMLLFVTILVLLALMWNRDPDVMVDDVCSRCPTKECPPGAGNGFSANDFYSQKANVAGLDPAKLSLCDNYWYYDGKFTCVRGIDPNGSCQHATGVCVTGLSVDGLPPGISCGDDGKYGNVDCQFAAVKWAIDHGLDSVACPLLAGS